MGQRLQIGMAQEQSQQPQQVPESTGRCHALLLRPNQHLQRNRCKMGDGRRELQNEQDCERLLQEELCRVTSLSLKYDLHRRKELPGVPL